MAASAARAGFTAIALALAVPSGAAGAPRLAAPGVAATATSADLRAAGFPPYERLTFELRRNGSWARIRSARTGRRGIARTTFTPARQGRYALRAHSAELVSRRRVLRARHVSLAAVGDINLGDGPGAVMRSRGARYPWRDVAPVLRGADLAFGNLECTVSRRGRPVPKQYNFRGRPSALRAAARFAGLDVLNLANNHTVDYGRGALLDTIGFTRRWGMTPVGAGRDVAAARRPRVVRRLGLRIAFVGFSDRLPLSFYATPSRAGTSFASVPAIRRGVRRARRRADVVVATFHWGDELARYPTARQRLFARTATRAGATAVIGAHPHVLQPRRRRGRRIVAYSLGNFVWSAGSAATTRTGILMLRLSGRGVEGSRFRRARIVGSQPRLSTH